MKALIRSERIVDMKKTVCLMLVLMMLFAAGCTGSMGRFAVLTAKIAAADDAAREEAAKEAGGFSALGLTERLFGALYKDGENLAYSPVSIYLALAMLAETAAGDTQSEILAALGVGSIEEARGLASKLLASETLDTKKAECAFANSIWMNKAVDYRRSVLETICSVFGADSFSGDPSDPAYSKALREWLDKHTKGLLKESVDGVELDPMTVLAIASTVYFDAEWVRKFEKNDSREGVFSSPEGEIACEFMHINEHLYYIEGDGFRAAGKRMEGGTVMWFILPDEGAPLETALEGISVLKATELSNVILAMPKLDVTSDIDLIPVFGKLGIKSCLDPNLADFSPLTGSLNVFVNSAQHAARVKADEERVKAAAFTLIGEKATAPNPDMMIEFTLDRPFLFVITGASGAQLFAGAVNTPGK